jgi:hypothetical protein
MRERHSTLRLDAGAGTQPADRVDKLDAMLSVTCKLLRFCSALMGSRLCLTFSHINLHACIL